MVIKLKRVSTKCCGQVFSMIVSSSWFPQHRFLSSWENTVVSRCFVLVMKQEPRVGRGVRVADGGKALERKRLLGTSDSMRRTLLKYNESIFFLAKL